MSFIVTEGSEYELPSEGWHGARCCDIIDLGIVENGQWGPKHKVVIKWQLEERDSNNQSMTSSRRFTPTLHEQGALLPFLEGWRGKSFTPEEKKGFDLDSLIDVLCQVAIVHKLNGSTTWANVVNASAAAKGAPPIEFTPYVRMRDRIPDGTVDIKDQSF